MTKGVVSVRVCKCVIAKNVGSSLYLGRKKGFLVAAISKVIYKIVST